jgi:hypothetical protein
MKEAGLLKERRLTEITVKLCYFYTLSKISLNEIKREYAEH